MTARVTVVEFLYFVTLIAVATELVFWLIRRFQIDFYLAVLGGFGIVFICALGLRKMALLLSMEKRR